MIQTKENGEKLHFEPDLGPLGQTWARQNVFIKLVVRHCSKLSSYMQCKGKLMNQTWENGEKPNFGPDFGPFSPNLGS